MTQPSWGRISIVAGAAAAAAAGACAAPAGATRAHAGTQVVDRTYSCRSAPHPDFIFGAQVRLPPGGQVAAGPAMATVTTANDHAFQVVFKDVKNSLRVDKSPCRTSSRRIALRPAGLPLYETVTSHHLGHVNARCAAAKRVLVRFRITMTGGKPERALFAVRNDALKGRQVEFLKWSASTITAYLSNGCTDTG